MASPDDDRCYQPFIKHEENAGHQLLTVDVKNTSQQPYSSVSLIHINTV